MNDYLVFVGIAIFFVPLIIFALWLGREQEREHEREYQRRKDEGWYI